MDEFTNNHILLLDITDQITILISIMNHHEVESGLPGTSVSLHSPLSTCFLKYIEQLMQLISAINLQNIHLP